MPRMVSRPLKGSLLKSRILCSEAKEDRCNSLEARYAEASCRASSLRHCCCGTRACAYPEDLSFRYCIPIKSKKQHLRICPLCPYRHDIQKEAKRKREEIKWEPGSAQKAKKSRSNRDASREHKHKHKEKYAHTLSNAHMSASAAVFYC